MTAIRQKAHELIDSAAEVDVVKIVDILTKAKNESEIAERLKIVRSLYGSIPADITLEEAREERLSKI
ncbi:MAG: hypothetical protein IKN12_00675 [Selenomonadaceae bacterium]|nr:hypothetical protein [Selenomonadaceae bacterium]